LLDIQSISALEVLRNRAVQINIYSLTYLVTNLCVVFQRSAATVAPRVESWRPGAAGIESVRHQARYDQSRTEEHPAAGESDDEDEGAEDDDR